MTRILASAALLALTASLVACGGSGGGAASAPTTGQLNLKITDAPVDGATNVFIVFTGVELQPASGSRVNIDFASSKEIDLLAYQDGGTADLLNGETVPAGDYNWMRLKVIAVKNQSDGSRIVFPDATYPLYIPSGAETGLKLNRPFRVAAGGVTRLVADFDLRKSIIKPPGQEPNYKLKPVLRLMDELETGTLEGTVDLRAMTDEQLGFTGTSGLDPRPISDCMAGVYLFERSAEGPAALPDDADGDAADAADGGSDPLLYFPLTWDGVNDTVAFNVAFLATGHYTAAATCHYDVDVSPDTNEYWPDPALDVPPTRQALYDTMMWSVADDVTITANQTTQVTLPVPPAAP